MTYNGYSALYNGGQYSQLNSGVALASSTTLTDISPGANAAGQAVTFPLDTFQPGQQFRVIAGGIFSTTGTPTLVMGLYLGGVAGVVLGATVAAATAQSSVTNFPWYLNAMLRVATVGATGTIFCAGAVNGPWTTVVSGTLSSTGNSVNTGASQTLTLGAQWGTSSASNSIQCTQFAVEQLA